jgi:hypothetical protein
MDPTIYLHKSVDEPVGQAALQNGRSYVLGVDQTFPVEALTADVPGAERDGKDLFYLGEKNYLDVSPNFTVNPIVVHASTAADLEANPIDIIFQTTLIKEPIEARVNNPGDLLTVTFNKPYHPFGIRLVQEFPFQFLITTNDS